MHKGARLLLLFGCLCCCAAAQLCTSTAPQEPQDRRTNMEQLVIGHYNTDWMFVNETSHCGFEGASCGFDSPEEERQHIQCIAAEVRALNADILHLAEVENCEALDTLNAFIGADFGYRAYLVNGKDTSTGQNVGLLTRVDPVEDVRRTEARADYPLPGNQCGTSWEDGAGGSKGVSKHLHTKFLVGGEELHLFGMHFLAFPTSSSRCAQREAQATVIAGYMQELVTSNAHVVVLGDMNDYDDQLEDSAGDVPNSRVLSILKGALAEVNDGLPLINVGRYEPDMSQRFSVMYDFECDDLDAGYLVSTIDHVLISPSMDERLLSAEYFHDLNVDRMCACPYSDHWPVVARLSWPAQDEGGNAAADDSSAYSPTSGDESKSLPGSSKESSESSDERSESSDESSKSSAESSFQLSSDEFCEGRRTEREEDAEWGMLGWALGLFVGSVASFVFGVLFGIGGFIYLLRKKPTLAAKVLPTVYVVGEGDPFSADSNTDNDDDVTEAAI